MPQNRKLFQHTKVTITDPDTGKKYPVFFTGITDMPTEVYHKLFQSGKFISRQVYQDGQELSPPMPFEDAAAYTEFKNLVEALAEGMEEVNR